MILNDHIVDLRSAFKFFDGDGNGEITAKELRTALLGLGLIKKKGSYIGGHREFT